MNTLPVALFSHHSDAEPITRRLNEAGIHAEIHHLARMQGARIDVPADRFERAYQLLVDWDAAEGGIRGAIRCPECHSLRVEYPQYSHKSTIPNLLVGVLANIGAMDKEFYCRDCQYTWP